jgi:hypothetical protein
VRDRLHCLAAVRAPERLDAAEDETATNVLDACDREQRMSAGKRPTLLVYRVICTDQDAMNWPEEDLGNLRVALNALVRLFRL